LRRTEALRHIQTVLIEIDHDDLRPRIELRGVKRRQTDRPGTDDGVRSAGLYFAVQHTAFEACRQDVAQHDQGLLVHAFRDRIEAGVGMRDADIFGLRPVYGVAKNPAARRAMRIHAAPAIFAFAAGRDAGDQDTVAL